MQALILSVSVFVLFHVVHCEEYMYQELYQEENEVYQLEEGDIQNQDYAETAGEKDAIKDDKEMDAFTKELYIFGEKFRNTTTTLFNIDQIIEAWNNMSDLLVENKTLKIAGDSFLTGLINAMDANQTSTKKLKTRAGESIRLTELLDEGVKRSKAKMEAKRVEKSNTYENITDEEFERAYHAVAYSCIKYADLSQNRNSDYVFSFDKMLDDRGNTAVYLLYAYARIRSIFRKADVSRIKLLNYLDGLHKNNEPLPLTHDAEFKLAKQILKFSDCILVVLDNLLMNQLCEFVYNLATTFHDFYNECYVIHQDQDGKTQLFYNRLILCEATADVMAMCFDILGLSVVEKM